MNLTPSFHYLKTMTLWSLLGLVGTAFSPRLGFSAPEISVSGELPRDASAVSFKITVVIKNITTADGQATIGDSTQANEAMKKRLKVTFSGIQGSQGIRYDDTKIDDKLFLIPDGGTAQTTSNGTQNITFSVIVKQLADKLSVTAPKELKAIVFFYKDDGTTELSKSAETVLIKSTSAPNAAPSSFSVLSSNRKLGASWTNPSTIAYTKDGDKAPPTNVRMFWVEQTVDTITLDAFEFKEDANDTATTCTLNTTLESGAECVSCAAGTNVYLSETQTNGNVHFRDFADVTGTTTADLKLDKKYAVFLMYAPFGVKRTACIIEKPTINYTLTELNGEGEPEQVDLRCFIATAAFGSPLHHHLKGFRWLRDRVLLKLPFGHRLVSAYYHLAPPVAAVIADTPWLQSTTRILLYPFAFILEGIMGIARQL